MRNHKKTSRLDRPNKYINIDQRGYPAFSGDLNFLLSGILPHFTHLPSTSLALPSLHSPSFIFSPSTFTTPSHKKKSYFELPHFPSAPLSSNSLTLSLNYSFYTLTFSQLLSPQTLPNSSPPLTLNPFTFPQLSSPLIPSLSLHSHRGFLT